MPLHLGKRITGVGIPGLAPAKDPPAAAGHRHGRRIEVTVAHAGVGHRGPGGPVKLVAFVGLVQILLTAGEHLTVDVGHSSRTVGVGRIIW